MEDRNLRYCLDVLIFSWRLNSPNYRYAAVEEYNFVLGVLVTKDLF